MLAFFATIGLNANLARLRAGGKVLVVFLFVVLGLLIVQNAIGIGMAKMLGLDPLMGLIAGSITLSGGHGTGAAWSKLFIERYGFENATEVAMACATFGLVLGGLIGGPVARYLVKHSSTPEGTPEDSVQPSGFEKPESGRLITSLVMIETIAMIAICLSLGQLIAGLLSGTVFELPNFVCVLFVGVILSNTLAFTGFYTVFERAVSVLGNVSLSLFLAMALMSLRLWELASLALPMLAILAVQTLVMALYAIFVTYRVMGKTTTRRCWPPATAASAWAPRRRRSPTCRRSPIASVRRTWRSWWCRWWARSLLISPMRSSSSCICCCRCSRRWGDIASHHERAPEAPFYALE